MEPSTDRLPDVDFGLEYWAKQTTDNNGVLGGYGNGRVPRVDALGSRQFLMNLLPDLCKVDSVLKPRKPLNPNLVNRRTRALDVGAGIGRVTKDVLLHLFDDVVLAEPVPSLVEQAYALAQQPVGKSKTLVWTGLADKSKSVTFYQSTLQSIDASHPSTSAQRLLGRVGYDADDDASKFDVIWCQWCLGHTSDAQLIEFLHRSKAGLREPGTSLIVVKENLCRDGPGETPRTVFDEVDSSLTRSDLAWKAIFVQAGLELVRENLQTGLPVELYQVKAYALK